MRIVLINGSPRQNGCTGECIKYLESLFNEDGVETVVINIPGNIKHCVNCRECKKQNCACVNGDYFKYIEEILTNADGIIIGSHVYYYSVTSQLQAFTSS